MFPLIPHITAVIHFTLYIRICKQGCVHTLISYISIRNQIYCLLLFCKHCSLLYKLRIRKITGLFYLHLFLLWGFPGGLDRKESACNAGDLGFIPGLGRSPGGRNSNQLQYLCLENSMDRGAWWVTVHGIAKSQTRLSNFTSFTSYFITGEGNGNPPQYSCLENPVLCPVY